MSSNYSLIILCLGIALVVVPWSLYAIKLYFGKKNKDITKQPEGIIKQKQLELMVSDYKERLGLAPKRGSRHAQLTHAELKAETLFFVDKLRDFQNEYDEEAKKIDENSRTWIVNGQTEEERDRIRAGERDKEVAKLFAKCIAEYKKRFKDDAILLRDELSSRLSEDARANRKCNDAMYDSPSIVFVGWIADELAMWAKMLK